MISICSGGNLRVRWHEWAGLREWMDCEEVSISGTFVVIQTADHRMVVVPQLRIYGQLEVAVRPTVQEGSQT